MASKPEIPAGLSTHVKKFGEKTVPIFLRKSILETSFNQDKRRNHIKIYISKSQLRVVTRIKNSVDVSYCMQQMREIHLSRYL